MNEIPVLLKNYSLAPFYQNKGPRREIIKNRIKDLGKTWIDDAGNLWFKKNPAPGKKILIDAHMDAVFGDVKRNYEFHSRNGNIYGTLDNSVGCAIATILAEIDSSLTIVFSVNEEFGGRGADFIIQDAKADFDYCLVLDLTFPDRNSGEVFCENFSSPGLGNFISGIIEKSAYRDSVGARDFNVPDNGTVFRRRWNSVSICPVSFGNMHSAQCSVKMQSVELCVDFLKYLVGQLKREVMHIE